MSVCVCICASVWFDLLPHLPCLYLYPYPNLGTISSESRHNIKCSHTLTNTHKHTHTHSSEAVVDHELVNTAWCRAAWLTWITVTLFLAIPSRLSSFFHSCLPAYRWPPPVPFFLFFCPPLYYTLLSYSVIPLISTPKPPSIFFPFDVYLSSLSPIFC